MTSPDGMRPTVFQEIVDEAKKPNSAIRLQQVILSNDQLQQKTVTVISQPQLASKLGLQSDGTTPSAASGCHEAQPVFSADEQKIAKIAYTLFESSRRSRRGCRASATFRRPRFRPNCFARWRASTDLRRWNWKASRLNPTWRPLFAKTAEIVVQQTIDIPRILFHPRSRPHAV